MAIKVNGTTINKLIVGGTEIKKVKVRQNESSEWITVLNLSGGTTMAYIYAGNWKMNMLKSSIDTFFEQVDADSLSDDRDVVLFPPACYLDYVKSKIEGSINSARIKVGIQDVSAYASGTYTGQISAAMAKDCGAEYALIGYSEAKETFNDTMETCAEKIAQALANDLKVIYCVGENSDEHSNNETETVLAEQLTPALNAFISSGKSGDNFFIAYEPVWATGTGATATATGCRSTIELIKRIVQNIVPAENASKIEYLCGANVKTSNKGEYLGQELNNFLSGGLSLKGTQYMDFVTTGA